jgi:hypothetical protein
MSIVMNFAFWEWTGRFEEALGCDDVGGGSTNVSWVLDEVAANGEADSFGFFFLWSDFGYDAQVCGTATGGQGFATDKVHGFGSGRCVREIAFGEAADFVGAGLDPVGGVGARAELFVFKESTGGWIDDGVGAVRKRFDDCSEIRGVERGDDAAVGLSAVTRSGAVRVGRRYGGGSVRGTGGGFLAGGCFSVGGSFLGGSGCGVGGSFLGGGFGLAEATARVTAAVLVCGYCW